MSRNGILRNGQSAGNGVRRNGRVRRRTSNRPGLTVSGTGISHRLKPDDLLSAELVAELRSLIAAVDGIVRFTICNLLAWPDEARWGLFSLLVDLDHPSEILLPNHGTAFPNLFQAVLHTLEGTANIERCERGKRAALEAAVLVYPESLEIACSQIADQFKDLGVRGILPQSLLKIAHQMGGQQHGDDEKTPLVCANLFLDSVRPEHECDDELHVQYFRGSFWMWDGRVWKETSDEQFKARVIAFLQGVRGCDRIGSRFVSDVITNLSGLTMLDCWDENPPLWVSSRKPIEVSSSPYLVFENGMVELQNLLDSESYDDNNIYEFDPRNFSSVMLPYEYDSAAECPLWMETLTEIFPRHGPRDHRGSVLQEFMGWTLIRGDVAFQKFLVLVGNGGNGKSMLLGLWEMLMGRDNASHVPLDQFNSEFRLVEMNGKLANIAADLTYAKKIDEGMLKSLTSGDSIQVNRKFKSPISMVPTARLIFATNVLPPINDRSDGIWRRMIAMPFLRKFTGDDVDLHRVDRLREELPGIFNWAIAGARRLYEQNDFTDCAVCRRCADEHRHHSDPFRQWVEEQVTVDQDLCVPSSAAFKDYQAFCDANGRKPTNSSELGKRVLAMPGIQKRKLGPRGSRKWHYTGLGLSSGSETIPLDRILGGRRRRRSIYYS